MILSRYRIAQSQIPGAGLGLFLDERVAAGKIIVAPDAIPKTWQWSELCAQNNCKELLPSSVRWFEEHYTVTPEWPDECYVNHAFEPTGVWHLGFIFAAHDLPSGSELTVDYRHLLGEGQVEEFKDAATGQAIVGLPWAESLRMSLAQLSAVLAS